jgi:hypothetical protein
MKRIATLLTHNDLDLPCVVLSEKTLFPIGKEVLVYAQNRLVRGYIEDDDSLVAELEIVVEFLISPELEEFIKDNTKSKMTITEIYYV